MQQGTATSLVHSVLVSTAGKRLYSLFSYRSSVYDSYSFLVADQVYVASRPPKSAQNPNPVQHVFSSTADDSSFEIYPDPRGNTLGQGTEITLVLKQDAKEYLGTARLTDLVYVIFDF
jgi:hypothetical protein